MLKKSGGPAKGQFASKYATSESGLQPEERGERQKSARSSKKDESLIQAHSNRRYRDQEKNKETGARDWARRRATQPDLATDALILHCKYEISFI